MNANRPDITRLLERTLDFLRNDASLLMSSSTAESLIDRGTELLEKSRLPGELLYVGILGGTGVGKSTLIDALAGKEISSISDRRPHTDRAVVYRHKDAEPELDELSHLVKRPDAVHEVDTVRDMVLMDLPDFDSIEQANRNTVMEMLPRLDCAVWVLSPEKYADEAFYRLLRDNSIHRDNFTFVVNKADQLVDPSSPDPHRSLKEVLGDLAYRLRHHGVGEQPRIFSLSAQRQFDGTESDEFLTKEFKRFRDFLMVRRDAKEIESVKTANLRTEVDEFLDRLRDAADVESKQRLIGSLKKTARGLTVPDETLPAAGGAEERLYRCIYSAIAAEDRSITPVRAAVWVLTRTRPGLPAMSDCDAYDEFDALSAAKRSRLEDRLRRSAATIDSELLLNLGSDPTSELSLNPAAVVERAEEEAEARFRSLLGSTLDRTRRRSVLSRFFQKAILFLPVVAFAVSLVGVPTIQTWLADPSVSGMLNILLVMVVSLFGPEGLTGVCTLVVVEVVLSFWPASRRLRAVERVARGTTNDALDAAERAFRQAEETMYANVHDAVNRLESGLERLHELESDTT